MPNAAPRLEMHALVLSVLQSMFATDDEDGDISDGAQFAAAVRLVAGKYSSRKVALARVSNSQLLHKKAMVLCSAILVVLVDHPGDVLPQRIILGGYGFGGNVLRITLLSERCSRACACAALSATDVFPRPNHEKSCSGAMATAFAPWCAMNVRLLYCSQWPMLRTRCAFTRNGMPCVCLWMLVCSACNRSIRSKR